MDSLKELSVILLISSSLSLLVSLCSTSDECILVRVSNSSGRPGLVENRAGVWYTQGGGKLGDWPPTGEIIRPLSGSITLPNSSVSVNSRVLELRDIPARGTREIKTQYIQLHKYSCVYKLTWRAKMKSIFEMP